MLSNGLVMQMSGPNINTNVAVSEGVGYGMLLALLNNDQTTFNKIFAAANSIMWSSSHKSYFNWKIVSGGVSGTGAATDAELDICLALIFADKLQSNSSITKWQAYNSGGVTYKSRATEMLQSIRSNMTASDFLLPGDNWGGAGQSNLNPSYFATGYMRVFDQYQSAVQFAPVAAKCYTVLKARSSQWGKGQAPDWCTSSGGKASQPASGQTYGGEGMTDDAIRTPWRICMDALWFDNSDAKTFCSNSRGTLTQYSQVTDAMPTVLLQQMAEYTNSGGAISTTAGSFHIIAMWLCGAIGSKDAAYTKKVINGTCIQRVCGQSNCFGDKSLSDQYYYYNQSIGMLGFAAVTGMFPNILSDTIKAYVAVTDNSSAHKSAALERFKAKVLSGGIGFTLSESGAAAQNVAVELYNVNGKKVFSQAVCAGSSAQASSFFAPISKSRLGAGTYLAKVTVSDNTMKKSEYLDRINWK
jgi:endo-1,4-beta-D-glucanase Y